MITRLVPSTYVVVTGKRYTRYTYIKGMKKPPNRKVSPNRSFFLKHVKKSIYLRNYYVIDFQEVYH